MTQTSATLEWRNDAIPVSTKFDDPYYSLDSGLYETKHVFLSGNDLPNRFCDGFHIAELGFGTALNFLAALDAWRGSDQKGALHFTSFEAYPMSVEDMQKAHAQFPEIALLAHEFGPIWQSLLDTGTAAGRDYHLTLIIGDAREMLKTWTGMADCWFLDGFSPAKNPELWEQDILSEVGKHTAPNGTAATYTAAGFVRRNLETAGFSVTRIQGYGRKRHMTQARKVDQHAE